VRYLPVLFFACFCVAQTQYPLTVTFVSTRAIVTQPEGTQTTTHCQDNGFGDVTCTSQSHPTGGHTTLVNSANLSDGHSYELECVFGAGSRFLQGAGQGMQSSAGLPTTDGCSVPPGTYQARWDKGRLKVLHQKGKKQKETTFVVLSSR
jgi:hypothetical protein